MIWTVMQISYRRLRHNRVELLLTFVVPIAFFSIFALIFGKGIGSGSTPKVKVVLVDEADDEQTQAISESLRQNTGLRFMGEDDQASMTRDQATKRVRSGGATIGIILKKRNQQITAVLLADASDQVAPQVVSALVGQELMIADAKQRRMEIASQMNPFESLDQQELQEEGEDSSDDQTMVRRLSLSPDTGDDAEVLDGSTDFVPDLDAVQIVDVMGKGKANPVVSMYAAGIAVMFLLFGATGGGGALLEERENTTLDRLLSTRLSMDQLLLGKWFYLTALGFVQVSVMFLWGQFVFGIDLFGHLDGFIMMTIVTSAAAAAFGLLLATLCKSRGQLNGLSVILILTMSALGGSMVPRYVMSDRMREMGQWTFNAWALDGYDKVFWRDMPVDTLWPELSVLLVSGVGFLLVARALAVRWETD